jgi:hypothetical protein
VFNLPRDERREVLDSLFDKLERANPEAILVVVVSEQHLTSMYALSSYDPDIVNAVCEIKPVGLADGLEQLSAEDSTNRVAYSPQVLQRLRDESQELERRGIDVTFDLLRLLRDRFSREARESGVSYIDLPQYEKIGGCSASCASMSTAGSTRLKQFSRAVTRSRARFSIGCWRPISRRIDRLRRDRGAIRSL